MGIAIVVAVHKEDGAIVAVKLQGLFDEESEVRGRADVVKQIEAGDHLYPLYTDDGGRWEIGPHIHVVNVSGKKYIRTDPNKIQEDNLGEIADM